MGGLNEKALRTIEDRSKLVIERVACPKCGADKGQPCVYIQVPKPSHLRSWYEDRGYPHVVRTSLATYAVRQRPNPWDRYEMSGKPMKSIHPERSNQHYQLVTRHIRTNRYPHGRGLSDGCYDAMQAMRKWDLEEYTRLVDWWREWGWLIENANAMRPDGTVRGDTYCLPPR